MRLIDRGKRQDLHRLDGSGGFRGLATSAAEARHSVLPLSTGSLGDAEKGCKQGAAQLVAQRGVAPWQPPGNGVAQPQGIARDVKCVESVMIELARRSLHHRLSAWEGKWLRGIPCP